LNRVTPYPARDDGPGLFYGWYIVAVGFFSQLVYAFHLSSTLSVFLKPLTEDLGVSRGLFSLLRSGEIIIGALLSPFIGGWLDRCRPRWLMAGGALLAGAGFILLSQVAAFCQAWRQPSQTVRGLAMLITLAFGAAGAPFFGFLFDATGSYRVSFVLFALALLGSALLSLLAQPPRKPKSAIARNGIT
jgi:hypothetical protein